MKSFSCCSKKIQEIQEEYQATWSFYRITVILEYRDKPTLPPPFIIICHLKSFAVYVYDKIKRCKTSSGNNDDGIFALFLSLIHI